MKVLITGITGFVGSHLVDYILANHPDVAIHGLVRWRSPMDNLKHIAPDKFDLHYGDLSDLSSLITILKEVEPDVIFHLAAQSYVLTSFSAPVDTLQTNIIGTTNLLEAVRISGIDPILHICSSSECYGQVRKEDIPITEDCPLRPASPYAVSKCVTPLTKIFTENGLKAISKIKVGDKVWTHKNNLRIVKEVVKNKYKGEMIHIILGSSHKQAQGFLSNCQLTITPEHPILTKDGWVKASNLNEGEDIVVVAKKCKSCGRLIPFWNTFCTLAHRNEYMWDDPNTRKAISDALSKREHELHCLHSKVANQAREKGFRKYLQRKGMNSHEFYLDLLINKIAPNTFTFVGDGKEQINGYYPDWVNHQYKLIIEYNGFGFNSGYRNMKSLNNRLKAFEDVGYKVLCIEQFNKPKLITEQLKRFVVDNIYDPEFVYAPIKRITKVYRSGIVYNLKVEEDNSYIAGGIIVHNCGEDMIAYQYWLSYGMKIIRTRMFTHTGKRRGSTFVVSNFAKQIASIEAGLIPPVVKVGNLDSVRTFADVRDAVRAYWLLVEKCPAGEVYNIGGVETMTIREMLNKLFKLSKLKTMDIEVEQSRLRPSDVTLQIPCIDKFQKATGWKPEIKFEKTLKDILDYWRDWLKC